MSGLENPIALLLIPLLALLGVAVGIQNKKRQDRSARLGVPNRISAARLIMLSLIPCLLMVGALMRPYSGSTEITVPSSSHDYMFVVDVSRSMLAKDVPPSRIELAKRKLKDLIDELTRQGTPHRYGITLFAGYSYLLCPVTDDTSVVKQFINEISPAMVTSLGSNLEAGISTALSRFNDENTQNVRLLLVSDGEDDQLSLERVVEQIKTKNIRVDVLGVGSPAGVPIELENGSFVRDKAGRVVQSKLGEESLQTIASAGSGVYVRATVDDRDIQGLAKSSLSLERQTTKGTKTIRTLQEFGSWLALAALGIIVTLTAFPRAGALIRVALLVILSAQSASASPRTSPLVPSSHARAAFDLYTAAQYEEARVAFKAALAESPNDPALLQGYASALFKGGKYKEAREIFSALAAKTEKGKEYFENTYNEGNALLELKRYREAIDAYTKALDVKPNDERALHNKAVARALLEEEQRKAKEPTPTTPPQESPQSSPEGSPSPQSSPQSSPSQSDSASPSPSSSPPPEPSPGGTPDPQASPKDGAETQSPAPSPNNEQGSPSPAPQQEDPERLKENLSEEPRSAQPDQGQPQPLPDEKPSTKEAAAWLESLPESPLLIRRERGRAAPGGQTW